MPRKFKSGEWVKVKGQLNAPKMQVVNYVLKKNSIFGIVYSNSYLECVWYKNGKRKSKVFHQNHLLKLLENSRFIKSNNTRSVCLT